jgi:hypothetical protein
MAKQQPTREQSRSRRGKQQEDDRGPGQNGQEKELARYEQELTDYLQDRIKPGLNSGAIPLLARSIAKDIAHRDRPDGASRDAQAEDENGAKADEGKASDFEADMHELQAELGEDWILRFSVQGDDAWLTAEKDDGSQRVEAPTASVISEAVELRNEGGGRST